MFDFLSGLCAVILGLLGGVVAIFLAVVIVLVIVVGVKTIRKEWRK